MRTTDLRYYIPSNTRNEYRNDHFYQTLNAEVNEDGFVRFTWNKYAVNVYNGELAYILLNRSLEVEIEGDKTNKVKDEGDKRPRLNIETIQIDCSQFLKSYVEGYKEGETYFTNEFKASPNVIYGAGTDGYIGTILDHYYEHGYKGIEGWEAIKKYSPGIITHKIIKEFGYYAGIVSKLQELIRLHPTPFKKALIARGKSPAAQQHTQDNVANTEPEKPNLTTQLEVAMYYFYMGEVLTRDNCIEKCRVMGVNANSDKPYQYFNDYSEKLSRTGDPESKQKLRNRIERIKRVLAALPEDKKELAMDELKLNESLCKRL